jgi:hypothetical protein
MFLVGAFLANNPLLVSNLLPIELASVLIFESVVKILEFHIPELKLGKFTRLYKITDSHYLFILVNCNDYSGLVNLINYFLNV